MKHVPLHASQSFCTGIKEYCQAIGKRNFMLVGEIAGVRKAVWHLFYKLRRSVCLQLFTVSTINQGPETKWACMGNGDRDCHIDAFLDIGLAFLAFSYGSGEFPIAVLRDPFWLNNLFSFPFLLTQRSCQRHGPLVQGRGILGFKEAI